MSDLLRKWNERWSPCPPIGHELPRAFGDRWVRFHSLPESKRYPGTDAEFAIVLHRYNAVLTELFAEAEIYTITCSWSHLELPPKREEHELRARPAARHWTTILTRDDPDPEDRTYAHLYVSTDTWTPGLLDPLLRDVADDVTNAVIIADTGLTRLYHPYDGGADVILTSTAERDEYAQRHHDWLSRHPEGF